MAEKITNCPKCDSKNILCRITDDSHWCRKCGWDSRKEKNEEKKE